MARPRISDDMVIGGEASASPSVSKRRKRIDANYVLLQWHNNKTMGRSDYDRVEPAVDPKTGQPLYKMDKATGIMRQVLRSYKAKQTDFSDCELIGEDFSGKNLQGVIFKGCLIQDCDFSGADLRWCDFTGCDEETLRTNNFEGANISESISRGGKVVGKGEGRVAHVWI